MLIMLLTLGVVFVVLLLVVHLVKRVIEFLLPPHEPRP